MSDKILARRKTDNRVERAFCESDDFEGRSCATEAALCRAEGGLQGRNARRLRNFVLVQQTRQNWKDDANQHFFTRRLQDKVGKRQGISARIARFHFNL